MYYPCALLKMRELPLSKTFTQYFDLQIKLHLKAKKTTFLVLFFLVHLLKIYFKQFTSSYKSLRWLKTKTEREKF